MIHDRHDPVALPVGRRAATRRQHDVSGAFQLEQQRASRHVLDPALRVAPVPAVAKLNAELRAAPLRMFAEQSPDQTDVRAVQLPPLHDHNTRHATQGAPGVPLSPAKNNIFFAGARGGKIHSAVKGHPVVGLPE